MERSFSHLGNIHHNNADMPRLLPWLAKEDPHGKSKSKHDNSIATPERKSFGQRTTVGTPSSVTSSHGGNRRGRQEQKDASATAADFLRSCAFFLLYSTI